MGRNRKKIFTVYKDVEICDAGAEGKAIGKVTNADDENTQMIVFVDNAVPGDVVDIQITRKKKNFREGRAIHFHKYSNKRNEALCKHFGICGGCKWQNMQYKYQLHYKQKQIVDSLERIGKIELPEVTPILAAPKTEYYRNKLEYTFSAIRWFTKEELDSGEKFTDPNALGFHIPKMFDKIVDVEHCYLQEEPSNKIRLAVKKYALENNLEFYNIRKHEGLLRNLIIRTSSIGEVMVILSITKKCEEGDKLLEFLANEFPEITSLMFVINAKLNDTITDLNVEVYKGNDHIFEEMEGLRFKIGAKSFYQTNSEQAYNLYKITRDYAQLKGDEVVYDLYTGTGTIANFVAKQAKKVVGIEYVPEAIEDAKVNSEINNIENTSFFAGDMKDVLKQEFITKHGKPEVIIVDPPRAGMHPSVVDTILKVEPNRIVYVSCNPATQARDINLMDDKYKVTKYQPVDMFPHTHHVENVVLLEKR